MPAPTALQITAPASGAPLTPAQKRFNTLIRQIEQARQTLAAWHDNIGNYRVAHAAVVEPLRVEYIAALRQSAFAMGAAAEWRGWTRAEREMLDALTCGAVRELLDEVGDDPEAIALFDKHNDVSWETEQREEALLMKGMAEAITGLDLGDDDELLSEDEVLQRLGEGMQQRLAQEDEARASQRPAKRKTPAQQRREAEEQQAAQSLREIFRKLASALHPDREPDPAERAAKTALMQRVNQAYAANDLLALLELQLQIEQIDASHIATASAARLKHYNKVMAEQLEEIRAEVQRMEIGWRMEFEVDPDLRVDPRRLMLALEDAKKELRTGLAELQSGMRRLADVQGMKAWLRKERKRLQEEDLDLDMPFF